MLLCLFMTDIMAWQMIPVSPKDEYSWKRSSELLVEVARHGEESGHGVPVSLDDLGAHLMSMQNSVRLYFCH
uniref:Uncharacterized protein n=1 Tax=Salix viminalis TaxID=40686 RepID=A0A6N2KNI0_SALVM